MCISSVNPLSTPKWFAPGSCVQLKGFTPPQLKSDFGDNYLELVYGGVLGIRYLELVYGGVVGL